MVKIRPNANPIPPWKPGNENAKSGKSKDGQKSALDHAAEQTKAAAGLTKSKASRMGRLMQRKAGEAGEAAGTAASAAGIAGGAAAASAGVGAAAGVVGAAAGVAGAAGGKAVQAMQSIASRMSEGMRQGLAGVMPRIDRFQNIMQRHTELGYLVRLGGKSDDENDDEIKRAALALKELRAGSGGGSPALTQLMDRVGDLDQNAPASQFAEQCKGAEEMIEQAGRELEELDGQLAFELQTVASKLTQAETVASEINLKFSEAADRVIGNI
ncbi:MAG: hypothetical protein HKN20_13535 [Gemmatimonadetes bacterium]|nr:hypothetical protein [Gemmatimonadota bacterium]